MPIGGVWASVMVYSEYPGGCGSIKRLSRADRRTLCLWIVLICQRVTALLELAPRVFRRLPGFIGPVPQPLWIRYSVTCIIAAVSMNVNSGSAIRESVNSCCRPVLMTNGDRGINGVRAPGSVAHKGAQMSGCIVAETMPSGSKCRFNIRGRVIDEQCPCRVNMESIRQIAVDIQSWL